MKTTKYFLMAALALMTFACSNDDRDFQSPVQPAKAEGITITATLAPKADAAATRALTPGDNKIVASWAVGEKIAILYEKGGTNYEADAEIKSVDDSGAATIEFSVESGTAYGTACKLIYPSTAVNDAKKAEKSYNSMLASQNGELNANFDVRVGAGTIHTTKPSLDVTTQPAPQYSIFKFAVKDLSGTNLSVSSFEVSNSQASITTVSLASAKSEFYVALPPMTAYTYWFSVTTADDKNYVAKAVVSKETEAGKYYQSTVQMATVGDVILSDGKFALASSTETKVAMVAYVGKDTDHGYFHGLAIAMTDDEINEADLSAAKNTCNSKNTTVPVSSSEWVLPSVDQWKTMFQANGGNPYSYTGLNTALETAGGDPLKKEKIYYTFTPNVLDETIINQMVLNDGILNNGVTFDLLNKTDIYYLRACLAF